MQAFFGGPGGSRTLDLCDANAALSQLSYEPLLCMVEARGVEPLSENPSTCLSTSVGRSLHSLKKPSTARLLFSVAS